MAPQGEHRLVFARLRQHGCGTTAITSAAPVRVRQAPQSEPLFDDPEASDAPRRHAGGRDCLPGDGSGAGLFRAAVRRSSAAAAAIANSAAEPAVAAAAARRAGRAADRLGARQRRAGRSGAILRSGAGSAGRRAAADRGGGARARSQAQRHRRLPAHRARRAGQPFARRSPSPGAKISQPTESCSAKLGGEPVPLSSLGKADGLPRYELQAPPARSSSTWSRAPSW